MKHGPDMALSYSVTAPESRTAMRPTHYRIEEGP
jgi:hypothetical protein